MTIPTSLIPSFLLNLKFELKLKLQGLFKGQKAVQEFHTIIVIGEIN